MGLDSVDHGTSFGNGHYDWLVRHAGAAGNEYAGTLFFWWGGRVVWFVHG